MNKSLKIGLLFFLFSFFIPFIGKPLKGTIQPSNGGFVGVHFRSFNNSTKPFLLTKNFLIMQDSYIDLGVEWAKKRGFSNIKANLEDFENPTQFSLSAEEDTFTPHITGLKTGGKSYFEIAMKDDNITRTVSKWKLLSTLAARKGGKLFLLTPRGHKTFTESLVRDHNLNAEIKSI